MSKYTTLIGSSALALAMLASPSYAQSSSDEIIVTATKRETTLQDTPISVSVTSAEVIEQAQILDILSLQSVVPNFRVSQLQNTANTSLIIRGFGNGGNNLGIEPAVGLFIDGVYRSRAGAQIADLPALERIEVLAGPQTTLFGKNASVGALSIVTEAPKFDTQGYIEAGYGNFDSTFGRGYLTGAITENIAVSLGGGFQQRDGFFEPAAGTAGGDLNDRNRYNLRAQVLWEPTDDLSVRLIADRSDLDENCCGLTTAVVGPTAGIVQALGGQLAGTGEDGIFSQETALNAGTPNNIDDEGISAHVDYTFGDITFSSITAYRDNESSFSSDSDFTSLDILEDVFQDADISTFTQEVRFTSNYDGRFNWQIGATYFDETLDIDSGIDFGTDTRAFIDALATAGASIADPSLSPLLGIEAVTGNPFGSFFGDDVRLEETIRQENDSFSIFGTVDFDVTDKFTITAGGNFTSDSKDVTFSQVNSDAFSNLTLQGADGIAIVSATILANGQAPIPGVLPNGLPSFEAAFGLPPTPENIAAVQANPASAAFFGGVNAVAAGAVGAGADSPLAALIPLQFQPQFLDFPNSVESGSSDDDDFSWSIRGSYEFNDNFTAYASAATGFKATSFNLTRDSRPFLEDAGALVSAGLLPNNFIPETGREFGTRFAAPEEITTFEVGLKTRFSRGAFNVALFDQEVENFQSTIFQGTGFVLSNAGQQSTQGFEFDGTFDVADWLTLTASGVIQDPEFDEFTGAQVVTGGEIDLADGVADGTGDLSGFQPAGINNVSLSTSATFKYDFGNGITSFLRGDYQFEDEVQVVDNIAGVTRSTNIFNGALGFKHESSGVGVRFWARNITDDRSFTSAFPGVIQAGTVNAYPNEPRTYGISLRAEFGG